MLAKDSIPEKASVVCTNKRCSHLHKGLAYFGRGDYEQAIEHLHPLLELESLSVSRKTRILILLYESYFKIGDILNAVKILHSHFYEDILDWHANCIHAPGSECHVNSGSLLPANIPRFIDAQQPYTEPSTVLEDDDSAYQQHCIPGDFTHCRPTDYFPYQHYYPNSSSNAHTGIVLELLNQGPTRENYITLLITANFIVEKMKENYSVHLDKVEL